MHAVVKSTIYDQLVTKVNAINSSKFVKKKTKLRIKILTMINILLLLSLINNFPNTWWKNLKSKFSN